MADSVLGPDIWKTWEKQGKSEFLQHCKTLVKENSSVSPVFTNDGKICKVLYDLIWQGIRGPLKKDAVVTTISELVNYHKDMASIILDVVNIIDSESSMLDPASDEQSTLGYIIKESEKIFSDKLLKERLEIDTLQEFKILNNRNFYTKFIKVKTKLYYKQRKFNLLREESEGFAKLITELNQELSGNVTHVHMLETIKSLIGCFNLDPNRVLDVILDSFEKRPEQKDFFIPLIKAYMPDRKILSEVLGYKFSFCNLDPDPTPKSLFLVTAIMLQHGIINLNDIYDWLSPDDKFIVKDWEKEINDAKEFVRKLNVVSTKEKEKEDQPEEKEEDFEKYERNQKFNLCEALLTIGDWNNALCLCKKLPDHCAMEQPAVAIALCKLIHSLIEPIYRKNSGFGPKIVGSPVPPPSSSLAPKPVTSISEFRDCVIPMLFELGPSLHYDLVLVSKVIRLLKTNITKAKVEAHTPPPSVDTLYYDGISLLDDVILPTLSFLDNNCCVAEEIWSLLKLYPYQCRYCLYSRWKNETYLPHAKLVRRRGEAQKKIKDIMKKISYENVKPTSRSIGKLTHYSPGVLFDYILIQIQSYDNLIIPVVDSLKYLTNLSNDMLGYCVIEALAVGNRDPLKQDSTSLSLWLQSLAAFCGYIFKKYNIELNGLLQYLVNELKMQKSLNLLILKEIIQKMAGIEVPEEMTNDQMEAMAGGDLLKGEAGYFSQVRNPKKSSIRLKEALSSDNLAVTLCLMMAQQRYCVVYRETEQSHLKLVGKLYDQCQDTLVQFGTFLLCTLSMEEYVNKIPSIQSQLSDYHIHIDVAFFLSRPMFTYAINQKYDVLRKAEKKMSAAMKQAKYCEAVAEVMGPVALAVRPIHPPKVWEDISPQFLVTFWSLTMYDLFVPVNAYEREIAKIKLQAAAVSESKDLPSNKQKKEIERYNALMDKLHDERRKQQEHVEKVMARLKQEKDSWFLARSAKSAKNDTITQLLQLCLFPRCVFTMTDSLYCAKFVQMLHSLRTANFSTLLCYDRLFCDITYSVTSCTENEANRYGRFLCAMLETVMRWHSQKQIFDEECAKYPGFVTKFRVSNQFSEDNSVGYENYRHVCHKWHYKITKATMVCLESKDYVQIRNALIILIKILPHFPMLSKLSQCIEKRVEKVKEDEKNQRQDLYTLATSYAGQLKAKAALMVREDNFHIVSDKPSRQELIKLEKADSGQNGAVPAKQLNGDAKPAEKEKSVQVITEKVKEKGSKERRILTRNQVESVPLSKNIETPKKEGQPIKEKTKEKESVEKENVLKKDERREDIEKRPKEKKEDKTTAREERFREERYIENMPLSKDEAVRVSGYYAMGSGSYYGADDRELSSVSNSSSGSVQRRSSEPPDPDKETKRRKLDGSSSSKVSIEVG
uniref:THO complex subunit 2 n=4 Tax=Clastoptera arizonana TaxID=38151 RepID=A0A1B6BZM5_9HEMI